MIIVWNKIIKKDKIIIKNSSQLLKIKLYSIIYETQSNNKEKSKKITFIKEISFALILITLIIITSLS